MVKLARMVGFITWEILIPCRRVEHFGIRGDRERRLSVKFIRFRGTTKSVHVRFCLKDFYEH